MTDFENTVLGDLGFETSNEQQTPAPAYESPLVNPDETTSFDNGVLSNLGFETEQVVPDITSSYEAGGKDDPSIAKQNKDFEQKHGMSLSDMTQIDPARAEVCKILNTTPEDFSKTYPRLANAYSNPYILSMAKEDTQSLMRIENGLKLLENQRKVANQVLGDQAENIDEEGATSGWESGDVRDQGPNVISATVQQGASQLFGGLFKTAISAVEAAGGNPDTLKVFDKSLNQIKQGIDSWGDDFTTMNKEWNWLQKNLAGGASSGVMMSLTYGAGFMLAAGLMASGIGTPAAMALMGKLSLGLMAMSAYGQAYDEGRKKGLSVGEAAGHGAWQGGWEYITEKMNIKAVKDLYFANKPMLRDIANFMKKEVGTEELNSFMQGIEEAFVMPDQTVGEFLKPANLLNMVAETAIQTVVGAGVQTGTARGLHSLVTSDTMQLGGAVIELAKTQENVNLLRSMADYAQNSALAQRAPEQLAKVVAEVTKNDTPWAYISNEALTPAIRDRIRAVAPDLDESITKAVTLQEDLAMPIEAFAQIINDESVVETLNDHVKFDQNGITVSEAKQNLAVIAEQSKAEVARLIEEQKKAADGTSETQQIIDDLTPILRDTGTIIGQTAKDQAVLWGKFFTRLSGQFQKAGKTVTPMELYKKYRSKIVGPDTEMVRMDTFNRMSKASRGLASLLSEFDKKVNDKGSKWGQVQWLKDRVQEAVKTLPEGNEMRTQLENIKSRNSEEYRNKVEAILKSAQAEIQTGYSDKFNEGVLSGEGRFVAYHDKRVNSYQAKANKIADALESAGASVRVSESKISNSCYVTAYANDDLYEIRISDHALPSHYAQPDFNAYPSKRLESASFVGGDYLDAIYSACKALSLETPKTVLRAIKKRDDEWEEARRIKEENQRKTVDEIVEFVKKNAEFILSISSTRRGTLNRNYDYYPQSTDNKSRAIYRLVSKSGKTYRFSEEAEKVLDIPEVVSKYARNELALVALANKVSEGDIEYVQSIVADPDYYKIAPLVNYSNSGNATIDSFTQRVSNILPKEIRDAMMQIGYHASPYTFDKFDLGKVGTGVFGARRAWGIHFGKTRSDVSPYKKLFDSQQAGDTFKKRFFYELNQKKSLSSKNSENLTKRQILSILNSMMKNADMNVSQSIKWIDSLRAGKYGEDKEFIEDDFYEQYGKKMSDATKEEVEDFIDGRITDAMDAGNIAFSNRVEETISRNLLENGVVDKSFDIGESNARVYETEIPNNDVLLMSRLGYEDQSDSVKKAIDEIASEYKIEKNNGKIFYDSLAEKLGSQKEASLKLLEKGVKGIYIDGQNSSPMFIIWDESAMKILDSENIENNPIPDFKYFDEGVDNEWTFDGVTVDGLLDMNGFSKETDKLEKEMSDPHTIVVRNLALVAGYRKNLETMQEVCSTRIGQLFEENYKETDSQRKLYNERLISEYDKMLQRIQNRIEGEKAFGSMKQIAYTGSPYIFDRFSLDHIGWGEGAQTHGWGLYFALNKDIAEWYRKAYSSSYDEDVYIVDGQEASLEMLDEKENSYGPSTAIIALYENGSYEAAKKAIEEDKDIDDDQRKEGIKYLKTYKKSKIEQRHKPANGAVYTVSIPDDNVMLVEDAGFYEQPEFVQNALKDIAKSLPSYLDKKKIVIDKKTEALSREFIEECRKAGMKSEAPSSIWNLTLIAEGGYSDLKFEVARDSWKECVVDAIVYAKDFIATNDNVQESFKSKLNELERHAARNAVDESFFDSKIKNGVGREIYREIGKTFYGKENRLDRAASELLLKYGIQGIRYEGKQDGPCAVVFDDNAVKILDFFEKHPEKLMEARGEANVGAERGDIAGWWSKSSNTLGLTKHTNITTFAHESGHMFLNIYFEIARDSDAPQSIKRDVATLLDWFGLKDLQQYFDLEAKGPDFVREYHEKFARGFEAYLREGKAPSKGLEDIFYKFKRWITDWYKDKTDKETIDNAQSDLTADVRAVMARMLASEEEIDRENKIRSFANLWQDRKNFPGNDEQYLDYIKLVKDSDLEARAMLTAAYMEELEFMTERKTVIMAELANQYNEEYNDAYEDAKERLLSNPLYKALERITKDEEAVSLKIATSEVSTLPENTVARLNALGVLSEDGMPLEAVSKQLGFEDPVEFINGMSKLQPLEQKAREMAEAQMTVDNEDIMTREGRDAVATAAVMNELAMKRAEKEYAIVKATKKTPELVSAATLDAEEAFGSMRLGSVKTGHYKQKANKASQNAVAAAAKGDTQAAADAKKAEVFSMAKAKKAADIINRKEKLVKLALRMKRKAKKLAQRRQLDSQFIDQVLSLMSHYTTRRNGKTVILGIENPSRRSFAEFKKAWTEKGVPLDAIDDTLFSGIKDIDDMTVDQFDTLADAVSILVTQGRRVSQISKENYKVNLQNTADEISLEIEDSHKELPTQVSRKGRIRRFLEGYTLGHRKFSSLIYELGGFKYGKFAEVTLTRLNNAAAREATMTQDFANKYWELVKNLKNLDEKALVKGINLPNGSKYSEMMTKRERIAIALNSGNAENKQRLEADGFDQLTIYNVFSTLTDDEIQFVQNAWDLIDQFWKPLADLELRTNGLEPKKVLPVPITVMSKNQQKIELKGGYYPIKYDSSMNTKAAEQEMKAYAESLFRGAVTSSATKQGHAKTRAEQTDMKLLLDPEVIGIHAQQVIHDLCYREALQDINKILRNDTVKNAIVSRKGAEWYSELGNSLMAIAMDGSTGAQVHDAMSNALGYLRGRMSASVMGLSVTTSLLQPLGLIQSAARIGPKAVLSGMLHAMNDRKSCYEMSEVMRNRRMTMNVEIRDVGRALSRTNNPKFSKAWTDSQKVIFSPITSIQQVVDVPTWYGAYDLARSEGKNEQDAIAFADQTVLDTQGSGDIKDMSRFHRDHPLMTMFYSYFSSTYQLLVESGKKNASKGALGATLFARDVVMLLAIPNIVTALFFGYLRGTEPPEDEAGWIKFILEQFGGAALNMFIGLRELSALINGYSYQGPAVARLIPDAQYLANAMLGDKDAFDKAMAVLPFVGDVTGIPTTQLARSLKGAKAYIEGETDMPTAVLFGKPTKEF